MGYHPSYLLTAWTFKIQHTNKTLPADVNWQYNSPLKKRKKDPPQRRTLRIWVTDVFWVHWGDSACVCLQILACQCLPKKKQNKKKIHCTCQNVFSWIKSDLVSLITLMWEKISVSLQDIWLILGNYCDPRSVWCSCGFFLTPPPDIKDSRSENIVLTHPLCETSKLPRPG